ncbi:branched-subunit amino acid aminotransferase/4-amino-4-deoxychorismate lyase [Actinoplanes lutulentus]|uniref:Branched-subunit amino acid aminotransferase/4-amino-4-deoxychorismate lyase n=1 Tax=Actinoplanes lutulentus TaxID=1287878 RepID=A0A327ZK75_9ACTN|nr:aminotransferase class IV [Actinoplanes lutulentus]MBB2940953.1 branched-subunit amino acid aminotransferase/4-amino-4-deoxychorismate lyase [Actinoplanes lutulentus]RAK43262.1 branched-subunit amino acid aminotransferase/4-amino-4-deoxychorismate lyase [Actinoplanes lutulentus]
MTVVEINGSPAGLEVVHRAATWNYGHYTSMQVRGGAVAGLSLHLARLRDGTATLFPSAAFDSAAVPSLIGHALSGRRDASVRVAVLPHQDFEGTDVMVSVSDPVPDGDRPPLRVRSVAYRRELPHVKHMATMGLTYQALAARAAGFDDVLFLGDGGLVLEGSVWNAVFFDGEAVVWPQAPMLAGITMQVLRSRLDALGVPSVSRPILAGDLAGLRGAATTNSHYPGQPITSIDDVAFGESEELSAVLRRAWKSVTWEPL